MPTTPKGRERLSWRLLPNPRKKRAHAERCPILFGPVFHRGNGRPSLPQERANRRAAQGSEKPFAVLCVCPAAGPLLDEAFRAQGHRGAAPYGVEEAKRAQGCRESENLAVSIGAGLRPQALTAPASEPRRGNQPAGPQGRAPVDKLASPRDPGKRDRWGPGSPRGSPLWSRRGHLGPGRQAGAEWRTNSGEMSGKKPCQFFTGPPRVEN